jgi:hypothetical protein
MEEENPGDVSIDCVEIEGALSATSDRLIPSLNIITDEVSTEVRAEEWEKLNNKCHSVFGASPECVPPKEDLTEVQSRTLTEVIIFVNVQKDSLSSLASRWLYCGEPDPTGIYSTFTLFNSYRVF